MYMYMREVNFETPRSLNAWVFCGRTGYIGVRPSWRPNIVGFLSLSWNFRDTKMELFSITRGARTRSHHIL